MSGQGPLELAPPALSAQLVRQPRLGLLVTALPVQAGAVLASQREREQEQGVIDD